MTAHTRILVHPEHERLLSANTPESRQISASFKYLNFQCFHPGFQEDLKGQPVDSPCAAASPGMEAFSFHILVCNQFRAKPSG